MFFHLGLALALGSQGSPRHLDPTYTTEERAFPHAPRYQAPKPDAHWIWTSTTKDGQVAYFSKSFDVARKPNSAYLYITADDFFQVTIDGHLFGGTRKGSDSSDNGWQSIHIYKVANLLTPGSHKITVRAENAGGPAGLLARLDLGGRMAVQTDKSWKVSDAEDGPWVNATSEAKAGEGQWGTDLKGWPTDFVVVPYYLLTMPIRAVNSAKVVSDPDKLVWDGSRHGQDVIYDFGKELTGRISVTASAPCDLTIAPGESAGEAIEKPWVSRTLHLKAGQTGYSPYSSQRYARITLKTPGVSARRLHVHLDHLYYPVTYRGKFDCSDPSLTKLWYIGAYTAHLCMQQDIWDAPKRDRMRWMGDLHVSGETIDNAFMDKFLMEQTMKKLRDDAQGTKPAGQLPNGHVNGIPGYSCAWIAGLADFYRHTGDLAYVKSQRHGIVTMIDYLKSELNSDGVFANNHGAWTFVDWSADFDKNTPEARAATHYFFAYAAKEAAFLLKACGDFSDAGDCVQLAHRLTQAAQDHLLNATGTFGLRRQGNAMAVYSGVAKRSQYDTIYRRYFAPGDFSWKQIATPYYNNYVIFAMSEMGHTKEAMDFVRSYWGEMAREGATSFWEGYDPSWPRNDFHKHLQADDGTGFFVSLCHGWSTGVTSWLTERVLGVRSTGGGFSTCTIQPDLGDLAWASGTVPTPHGPIRVHASKDVLDIQVPHGVKPNVVFRGRVVIHQS